MFCLQKYPSVRVQFVDAGRDLCWVTHVVGQVTDAAVSGPAAVAAASSTSVAAACAAVIRQVSH